MADEKKDTAPKAKKEKSPKKDEKIINAFWMRGHGHYKVGDPVTASVKKAMKEKGMDESKYIG